MNEFLYEKGGQTFQSIPVAVFYTKELRYLYHYTEFPRIYHKDRLAGAMRAARPGETPQQTWDRFMGDWRAPQPSPVFPGWAAPSGDPDPSAPPPRGVVSPLSQPGSRGVSRRRR